MNLKSILCLFTIILVLVGCTTDSTNIAEFKTEHVSNDEVVSDASLTPLTGGVLNISMRSPKTLNPLMNDDYTVDNVLKLIFEPLFTLDSEQRILPNIGESYSLSQDGMSMTVALKQGISWHDGKSITADDLIFSLDTIKSAPEGSIYKKNIQNVVSYKKLSSNTIIISYSKPFDTCAYNLCFPLIPKHYYSGATAIDSSKSFKPIGSGLYELSSYRVVREMMLKKSSNFKGTPYIDNVKVVFLSDVETDLYAFEQGITDVITVDVSQWGKFSSNNSVKVTNFNTNNFEFLGFNFKNPMLNNVYIRQAIAYSIPYNEIVENIYINNAVKTSTPINPTAWFNNSEDETIKEYSYNILEAKKLIASSGFTTEQLTFSIIVNEENNERIETAKIISDSLNQIGMKVTVNKMPFETYKENIDNEQFQMFIGGMLLNTGNNIRQLISYIKFSDLTMNTLINNVESATNEENYKVAINELKRYCINQLPCVGICFKSSIVLTNGRIKGEKIPVIDNQFNNIEKWYIEG